MRVVSTFTNRDVRRIMQGIKVDPYGIDIMTPKSATQLIRINSISNIAANILKQEMLSLGGDAALARSALTGQAKKTDCLLIGNHSLYKLLEEKLNRQPFGLALIGRQLQRVLFNFQKNDFTLKLKGKKLALKSGKVLILGIINLTPDSFSNDGLCKKSFDLGLIFDYAQRLALEGADILDLGGESTRPGAARVSLKEELRRVIPAVKKIASNCKIPISVDTYKFQVAQAAIDAGASIVNDISGLKDFKMRKVIARSKTAAIIMHSKGTPRTMQDNPTYVSLIDEITAYLSQRVKLAKESGIDENSIIIDPGLGFGKAYEHNLQILRGLRDFKGLGLPILVGPSRKSFLGKIINARPNQRLNATISACVLAAQAGANLVRVHDVKQVKEALKVFQEVNNA